jgi:hypothetical protein
MRVNERQALKILEKLGFKYIGKSSQHPEAGTMNYDFEVEKNGATYTVEVETTAVGRQFRVPWEELREMGWQFIVHKKNGLLVFVDELYSEYCIFEIAYTKIGLLEKEKTG